LRNAGTERCAQPQRRFPGAPARLGPGFLSGLFQPLLEQGAHGLRGLAGGGVAGGECLPGTFGALPALGQFFKQHAALVVDEAAAGP